MNQTAQHISPDPALDFAQGILEETNGAIELIDILREIAEGSDEDATTNDLIAANVVLTDRAFGKCPTLVSPNPGQSPHTDSPAGSDLPTANEKAESPRLVTQIDQSLNQSLGPAPSAHSQDTGDAAIPSDSPEPFDPYSVHFAIQQYILSVTNNGRTLRDALLKVARTKDDPKVKPYHRQRSATILVNRVLGTNPNAVHKAVCPSCRRKWTAHPGSHTVTEPKIAKARSPQVRYVDPEALAKARAEIQRMKDEGILTPYPRGSKPRITVPEIPEGFDVTPYKEEAAKFWADIELTLERQKQWPAIEERRRKKLAQIYPSHSEDAPADSNPPDP